MSNTSEQIDRDELQAWHCVSAEDFLTVLNSGHAFWQRSPPSWIFRGHACASWKLLPKAHRPDTNFEMFGVKHSLPEGTPSWVHWSSLERQLLRRFHRALDQAGLSIPAEHPSVEPEEPRTHYSSDTRDAALPLLALAQHFGLPTRLLDWTRHAAKAAYFAAEGTIGLDSHEPLAVWALRGDLLEHLARWDSNGSDKVRLVTAPAASNPNLHAQSAVFTQARGGEVLAVDTFVTATATESPKLSEVVPFPWMRKVTLHRAEAPKLLRLLSYTGINGSSMFPGYAGVVKCLREEAHWDRI